ncbi:hypothetical protein FRB94_011200 [Tulasnella sp. JGI-2019a]|nr:hypothetical protein FRB94_011200 [Tulasnella sp. JGI-2019a]KAG9031046.1 hypothetical protein FRB95_003211 [Tulasnella sp. JGI-2019a]
MHCNPRQEKLAPGLQHQHVEKQRRAWTLISWPFKNAAHKQQVKENPDNHDTGSPKTGRLASLKARFLPKKWRVASAASPVMSTGLAVVSNHVHTEGLDRASLSTSNTLLDSGGSHCKCGTEDYEEPELQFLPPPPAVVKAPHRIISPTNPPATNRPSLSRKANHQRLRFTPEGTPASSMRSPISSCNSQLSTPQTTITSLEEDATCQESSNTVHETIVAQGLKLMERTSIAETRTSPARESINPFSAEVALPAKLLEVHNIDPNIDLACKMYASISNGSLNWWSTRLEQENESSAGAH